MKIPNALIKRHKNWSEKNFGTAAERGPIGPLRHLIKEAQEAIDDPSDITEFADCQFLLLDALRRAGHSPDALVTAMEKKMPVLESRTYRKVEDGQPSEHVREGEAQ